MSRYVVTQSQAQQLEERFTYHPPKEDQAERYVALRNAGKALAVLICECSPECREQSLALTRVEEAIMMANAAIARRE